MNKPVDQTKWEMNPVDETRWETRWEKLTYRDVEVRFLELMRVTRKLNLKFQRLDKRN